jgi:hypothetical protein
MNPILLRLHLGSTTVLGDILATFYYYLHNQMFGYPGRDQTQDTSLSRVRTRQLHRDFTRKCYI